VADGVTDREAKAPGPSAPRRKSVRGKRLGRYVLQEHLADGGMAEIFLARLNVSGANPRKEPGTAKAGATKSAAESEPGFAKDLVLKVLQERFADNPAVVAMFLEEARLSAGLRHPNIVDVHDFGEDAGVRFIAMEYIDGRTLTDVVTRALEVGEAVPLHHAVHIVAEVAAGLAYLDGGLPGRGRAPHVVHRDISPTNIVIGWAGQTKIIDFGIAQQVESYGVLGKNDKATKIDKPAKNGEVAEAEGGARPGKVAYMSPEQVRGLPLDPRSDLFSLGTILYEITLGRRLWRGAPEVVMRRIVEEAVVPPTYLQRDYPPALERIVLRALEKRPQDRQASAADMLADLDSFLADVTVAHTSPRALGEFVRTIYAPGAQVSARGARRAQIFQDDDGAMVDPENAPLDFDRGPARPGSGAALAHALRGAEPFELASDVTNVSAAIPVGAPAPVPPAATGPSLPTPPADSLRTPPPISLRNALAPVIPPAPTSALAPPGTVANSLRAAGSELDPPSAGVAGRVLLIGLLLTILLAGIFFALRGS
jgi:serine/threonine protein kinase